MTRKHNCLFFHRVQKNVVQLMLTVIFLQLPYKPLPFPWHPHRYYTDTVIKRGWKAALAKQLRIFLTCYRVRVRTIPWCSVAQRSHREITSPHPPINLAWPQTTLNNIRLAPGRPWGQGGKVQYSSFSCPLTPPVSAQQNHGTVKM